MAAAAPGGTVAAHKQRCAALLRFPVTCVTMGRMMASGLRL